MLLRELEPEKYWAMPASWDKEKRQEELDLMISSGKYYFQLKTDGNYSAFCCDFDGDKRLITRGVSKTTGEYGVISDKVFFFDALCVAFDKPTRILAEVYLDGGIDRQVGSILRSLPQKAKSIQDEEYYNEISKSYKFSAKDKRDIEGNEFRNQKLKWRIFDVWYYDGIDLMNTPWIERQKYVAEAAKRINHPLVSAVKYKPMNEKFYDELAAILNAGGEGVVCYLESGKPEPGKRSAARKSVKVKKEMQTDADLFIVGVCSAEEDYKGKEIFTWNLWEDLKTGEKLEGQYYTQYHIGERTLRPISKNYFNRWPSAIVCAAWDSNHKPVVVCKCAGLDEEFKTELRDNFDKYYMMPVKINGMMVSSDGSIRHPRLVSLRQNDIDVNDCTLDKLL